MKHGIQKKLAEQAGISPRYINKVISGGARASKPLSILMESLSGVDRDLWRNPDNGLRDALDIKYPG